MSAGLQVFDEQGKKIFDSDDLLTFKYLGSILVTQNGQQVADSRFSYGTPIAFATSITIGAGITDWARDFEAYEECSNDIMTFYLVNCSSAFFIYGVV